MEYFSEDYKKYLAEHYVLDAWQFVNNMRKNIDTASYCCHIIESLISKMEEEHKGWQEEINRDITHMLADKGSGSVGISYDKLPSFKMDMFGLPVDYHFLIDKYIKDFFQYIRNAIDSAAQIVNSALLANQSLNIEKVDFNKVITELNKPAYSQIFTKTLTALEKIQTSNEFAYVSEFNNRIKHISDAKIIMSHELFGEGMTSQIDAFYKKGNQFAQQDILTITKRVFDFLSLEIISLLDAITDDIKQDNFIHGRIHDLKFHVQNIKDEPDNSFTVIFAEVLNTIDELPDILRVLLVKINEEISSMNSDYDDILVRDKDGNYLGRYNLDEVINNDGLLQYRRYKKDNYEGILSFIEQTKKKYPISPFLMTGNIVSVGFSDEEPKDV
ncbi:hypothetical protein MJ257_02330 [Paenibacillus timonensis]|uniref:LXG domain-containing protein n=1 Tax=Paenibacillus timonensis TaxID=225915 RepID=A0ABW3S8R6_9BACL|nr:hypothetical protein [Paenibacillus timonensis]MCH1638931.1 hypothetical protein [Paenibacillus timonensis]